MAKYCLLKQSIVGLMPSLLLVSTVFAKNPIPNEDKRQYHLFNPVPKNLMREMSTDRPDKTESAYTVDTGHYQFEISAIDYTNDRHNPEGSDTHVDNFSFLPMNIKAGLLNSVDLQLVYDPYLREKTEESGDTQRKSGNGDLQTRLKINIWGNDGGTTALAIMPFVKFPTNTDHLGNDEIEGGIIVPLAVSLPGDWGMGVMTEFDFYKDAQNDYYTDYVNTITFSHAIIGDLSGYIEFFSSFNNEPDSPWVGTVDGGLTYALNDDIQLDMGINIGVTRSADDFNPFCGISMRY